MFLRRLGLWITFTLSLSEVSFAFAEPEVIQAVTVIDQGPVALAHRLALIEKARSSIEIESFYFAPDQTGRLLLQALIEKKIAAPQLRVRLLVDAFGSGDFTRELAALLARAGIEVRHYNDVSAIRLKRFNHRDHRKLFLIDGVQGLLGGYNTAVEHFGFNSGFNHVDRELLLEGAIVQEMTRSFEDFWASDYADSRFDPLQPPDEEECAYQDQECRERWYAADAILRPRELDLRNRARLEEVLLRNPGRAIQVRRLRFVTDEPGLDTASRKTSSSLDRLLRSAHESALIEGTHFIPTARKMEIYRDLLRSGVRLRVLTNSMRSVSTNAVTSISLSLPYQCELVEAGAEIFGLTGANPLPDQSPWGSSDGWIWGTHAKTILVDRDAGFVGTFNLDPRSENTNVEAGVFFESTELNEAVRESIETRIREQSIPLHPNGTYTGDEKIPERRLTVMQTLEIFLVQVFRRWFEPLF